MVASGEDVHAALAVKIRTEQTPEIDAFEAMKVIEQLSEVDTDDVVPSCDSFRVTLHVMGAATVHLLKMPSAKDVFDYRRCFDRVLDLQYSRQELTINRGPASSLYERLAQATEG